MFVKLQIIFSILVLHFSVFFCYDHPKVTLPQGEVQGRHKHSYIGRIFTAFEGIPYAKPPIDELRFKAPIPADNWEGILIANKSTKCSQTKRGKYSGSEDCLYLNVFIPRNIVDQNDNFDVVIYIHGGAFQSGSISMKALPDYVMDKEIIMVAMNYRLGTLGFLSTEDEISPGNYGLKDQVLALKWIKENIQYFGGNPQSITLTGSSAGGMSVHYHFLSPLSKGLFNRGYSISGVCLVPRTLEKIPLEKAKIFSKKLNCTTETTKDMVDCLKTIPPEILTKTRIEFRPSIERKGENKFLPDHPYKLLKDGKIFDVPWVTSNVIDEAYAITIKTYNESSALEVLKNWDEKGPRLLEIIHTVDNDNMKDILKKLKEAYFAKNETDEEKVGDALNRLMTDRHYIGPADLALRTHAKVSQSPIYYSLSSFVPEDYLQCAGKATAASHCADSRLLFKWKSNPKKLQPKEEKMMFLMTDFLEKYAKTGIPQLGEEKWMPIVPNQDILNVLRIESPDNIKMKEVKELIQRKLWNSLPIKENDKLYN